MRTPMRAAFRLALTGWLGLAGLSLSLTPARAATPPEKILPDTTILFVKANNAAAFRESFRQSQYGQLWNDPAMKEWRDDLAERINDASKSLKEKLGASYRELLEIPQGTITLAVVGREDPKVPAALYLTADVGKNTDTATDVLTKAGKQAEDAGGKVTTETFKGATLHVIQPPPEKDKKDVQEKTKGKGKDKDKDRPQPPLIWTNQGSIFHVGTDLEVIKEVLTHAAGRDDSLAASDGYSRLVKKLDSKAQVVWYVDVPKAVRLVSQAGQNANPAANKGAAANTEAMLQMSGINGLKALGGSFVLNVENFDSVSKTIILAPVPVQGLLKMFHMPKVELKPEPWVPATVASYQTFSWDLDAAYTAINDLANMFQPGMLSVLEQQLVGPNGGDALSFKKDLFGPLGDRVTVVSDFKKPVKEDSQRMLLAIALEDAKAFQNTLNKLIALTNAAPKKREFQGTTIYDFEMPDLPNANAAAGNVQFKGPISVAIAKGTLFASSEPTLLEQVLRGGASLAESAAYQAVAKEIPDKVSSLSFVRPDEQARLSYDMLKSGQFEKALQNAAAGGGGPDLSGVGKLIDKTKIPNFSVFAKYLSAGGSYGLMDDDGYTITSFTLRKEKP